MPPAKRNVLLVECEKPGPVVTFCCAENVIVPANVLFPDPVEISKGTEKAPVDGLNDSSVEETLSGRLPVLAVTHVGNIVALVVTSFAMPLLTALVAVPAVRLAAVPLAFVRVMDIGVPNAIFGSVVDKEGAPLPSVTKTLLLAVARSLMTLVALA